MLPKARYLLHSLFSFIYSEMGLDPFLSLPLDFQVLEEEIISEFFGFF